MSKRLIHSLGKGLFGLIAALSLATTGNAQQPAEGYVPIIPGIIIIPFFPRPVQASCEITTGDSGSYFVSRDVRITSYNGWSADAITFRYDASLSGSYSFRIVIRETDRNGDIITRSELRTVSITANTPANVTTYFSNVYVGRAFALSISHENVSGPGTLYFLQTSSATGCTNTELTGTDGTVPGAGVDIGFTLRGDTTHTVATVIEYYLPDSNKYFITGTTTEIAQLDALPTLFTRTGRTFIVPKENVFGNVRDVYRFFAPAPGAQSHVFVEEDDRNLILSFPNTGLVDEGVKFGTIKPDNADLCPTWAPTKVYRAFHNTVAVGQRNHRYSTSLTTHNVMLSQGWEDEGVVFCAY